MKLLKWAFLLLFFPCSLFAAEDVTIRLTLSLSKYVMPDIYTVPVVVSVKLGNETQVLNVLGRIDEGVRGLGLNYKGGVYSVRRVERWDPDEKKHVSDGFRGIIRYRFLLAEPSLQNRIFSLFARVRKDYPIEVEVRNPQWIISDKRVASVSQDLRIGLLRKAMELSKSFGETLGMRCSISRVHFTAIPYRPLVFGAVPDGKLSSPVPERSEKKLLVAADTVFVCR